MKRLLQDEVNPVMSALLDAGFDVTALHNHFFRDEPRMLYMHVHGHGAAADLGRQLGTSGSTARNSVDNSEDSHALDYTREHQG